MGKNKDFGEISSNNGNGATADIMGVNLATNELIRQRASIAQSLGKQFNGRRDLYDALGYPKTIQFDEYLGVYERQDIAGRIVDLPADDAWRIPPVIVDGEATTAEDAENSPFTAELTTLVDKRRLWSNLSKVDRLSGVGRFGVLFLGLADDGRFQDPVDASQLNGLDDLLFLSAFHEGDVDVDVFEDDPTNERFGLPKLYRINFGDLVGDRVVHWSRVIHVAEKADDDVFGRPRLERIFNRLLDLEKIVGGGSEATWRVMDRGLHVDVRDGFKNPIGDDASAISDEIEEYIHGFRRFIRTQGMDVNSLGGEVVDPSGLYQIIVGLIASASNIPQRILVGSERGELASTQDASTWAGSIASRQARHVEPNILRPTIDRLVRFGVLTAPSSGRYAVEWSPLFTLSQKEVAEIKKTENDAVNALASAIQKVAPSGAGDMVITPDEFRERFLGLDPLGDTLQEIIRQEESDGEGEE